MKTQFTNIQELRNALPEDLDLPYSMVEFAMHRTVPTGTEHIDWQDAIDKWLCGWMYNHHIIVRANRLLDILETRFVGK